MGLRGFLGGRSCRRSFGVSATAPTAKSGFDQWKGRGEMSSAAGPGGGGDPLARWSQRMDKQRQKDEEEAAKRQCVTPCPPHSRANNELQISPLREEILSFPSRNGPPASLR